jgi:preprotein translocase subunit YajC
MLTLLSDPVFIIAVFVFILVLAYFAWVESRAKQKELEERLRKLEKQQEEQERRDKRNN